MSLAFRKILVPTDFSEAAEAALYYGRELAHQFDAELHVLHVFEGWLLIPGSPDIGAGAIPNTREQEAVVRARLERLLTPDERALSTVQLHVVQGLPASVIPQFARDGEFELIVMGTHGRGFIQHALMGSVAEAVVRSAPCPVLTIRHGRHRRRTDENADYQGRTVTVV